MLIYKGRTSGFVVLLWQENPWKEPLKNVPINKAFNYQLVRLAILAKALKRRIALWLRTTFPYIIPKQINLKAQCLNRSWLPISKHLPALRSQSSKGCLGTLITSITTPAHQLFWTHSQSRRGQHSYGNAIDISVIDGVSISANWEGPAEKACRHFTNILTPATNAAHQDHLHLDKGMGLPCWA